MPVVILFFLFIIWIGWASSSTGGLYELKQFNPDYVHPNKNVAYLVSKINWSESNGYWDSHHVEMCSAHMPDWEMAKKCVKRRLECELLSPKTPDQPFPRIVRRDIFSDAFTSCWKERRPSLGPMAWLRLSRAVYRLGVFAGAAWVTGGFTKNSQKSEEWIENNRWWAESLEVWLQKGQ